MKKLTLQERFGLWEKLPDKDVMDFPIGPLTDEQYEEILDKLGIPRTIDDMGNNIEQQYLDLLKDIINNGLIKTTRNGETLSVFGRQIRHKMSEGFPLLTTKKMAWKQIVTELIWFLKGDTNIKYLIDNDCHIWDGDVYKRYFDTMNSDEYIENWIEPNMRDEARKNKGKNGYTKEEFINEIKTDDEFAKTWGELGPIYGKQWRRWEGREWMHDNQSGIDFLGTVYTDQIHNLINELKTNPDSRRMMVNAWNVGELDQMTLPPCHYGFQVYTRGLSYEERLRLVNYDKEKFNSIDEWITWYNNEPNEFYYMGINYTKDTALTDLYVPTRAISLMWNQRSVDTFLGLPFNIASYGLLLLMIADEVNMVPDELIGNLGDTHLYLNHIEQAKEQIGRTPYTLPTVHVRDGIESFMPDDVILQNYQSHPTIKAPLSN